MEMSRTCLQTILHVVHPITAMSLTECQAHAMGYLLETAESKLSRCCILGSLWWADRFVVGSPPRILFESVMATSFRVIPIRK